MAHHADAQYDPAEEIFLPPSRTIGFNPQLTINDSLLVQSYIEAYDISYPEALKRIIDEVGEIRQHLLNDGRYELNDIGVISLNDYGKYEFEPCEAGILTPELYGLSSFEILPYKKEVKSVEAAPAGQEANTLLPESGSTKDAAPAMPEEKEEERATIPVRISLLRNLAAACIAVVAFLLFSSPLDNKGPQSVSRIRVDKSMLYQILPKDVVTGTAGMDKKSSEKAAKIIQELKGQKKDADSTMLAETKPGYTIVLASRISRKNAADYVRQLHSRGLSQARIMPRKYGAKVIFGQYPTEREAYNKLNKMNDQQEFADCWVMKIN